MTRTFANELSTWLPRISGAAFKCLFVIYLELAVSGAAEVVITRRRFIDVTGLSKSAVTTALGEIDGRRAAVRRATRTGFAYSVPGLKIDPTENQPGRKSIPTENQPSRPADLFDVFLQHWARRFPGETIPRISPPVRSAIAAQLQRFSYKELRQAQKGLAEREGFPAIGEVINPQTTIKAVKRGQFLYFEWRDALQGGTD